VGLFYLSANPTEFIKGTFIKFKGTIIIFGGAILSAFLVFGIFVVSLCTFLYKWATSSSK